MIRGNEGECMGMSVNRNSPKNLQCLFIFLLFLSSEGNEGNKNIESANLRLRRRLLRRHGRDDAGTPSLLVHSPLPKTREMASLCGFQRGITPFPNSPCRHLPGHFWVGKVGPWVARYKQAERRRTRNGWGVAALQAFLRGGGCHGP
jgi:hypothetical protein